MSFSISSEIEFRNRENLNEIILTHSVAPHQVKPKPLGITANSNFRCVQDMCAAESENEKLLIVISYEENELIRAFTCTTGELKWRALKKIPSGTFQSSSITGDVNGRLFVADHTNECIQMFSASDGQYLGCLLKREDQGLGIVEILRWSEATASLVVGHQEGRFRHHLDPVSHFVALVFLLKPDSGKMITILDKIGIIPVGNCE